MKYVDIYVLDRNLNEVAVCDDYKSLIWADRYNTTGDCELYVTATIENVKRFRKNYYLYRQDTNKSMICRIKYVELDTSSEDGDYLIIKGIDCKSILAQRIIWGTSICNGRVEEYLRKLVDEAFINPSIDARRLKTDDNKPMFALGTDNGFDDELSIECSYRNIRDKIEELNEAYERGYRVYFDRPEKKLKFELTQGEDVSALVIFSDVNDNLFDSTYVEDSTNIANIALVGGEGEGSERKLQTVGAARGMDRYEIFVDARDQSSVINYEELKKTYPLVADGGNAQIIQEDSKYYYYVPQLLIPILNESHKAALIKLYPNGRTILQNGRRYYKLTGVKLSELPSNAPEDNQELVVNSMVYYSNLITRGIDELAAYGEVITFQGEIDVYGDYQYRVHWNLGDLVTVENKYGVRSKARILSVTENYDDTGIRYTVDFEFKDVLVENVYLLTEAGDYILTENGDRIVYEEV